MTSIYHRAAAGAAVAALLALAGCSSAGAAEPAEPPIGEVPTLLASVGLRLPVEDYLPTAEQGDRLGAARLALIRRCMARFGIDYPVKPVPASGHGPRSLTDRRYGITDIALARTAGYGLGPRDPKLATRPERPKIGPDGQTVLSGRGRSVVNGLPVPDGGCIAEADRALDQAVPAGTDVRIGNQLQLRTFEVSKRDSRVQAAFAAWSECMRGSGYRYGDPLTVMADPAFTGEDPAQRGGPSPAELAVAAADIDCKARTNLVGIWFTVESAYQRREIDADRALFVAAREAIAARDRAATAIGA
ncbi:MAG TPA: hypothetical protein VFB84_14180 [Micromonosporaceae bacterium]|nr:hypothetical protein [Micromonosporaceae bacterium]